MAATIASASALAADDESGGLLPSQSDIASAIESGASETNLTATEPAAAEGVPLEGLQREEAVELLNGVFGESVEGAAGIYDELQEATLLSPHVAVVPEPEAAGAETPGDEEQGAASEGGEPQPESNPSRDEVAEAMPEAEARRDSGPPPKAPAEPANASLVDSTIPLEVGEGEETLDLSLEHHDGALESVAPLVRTRIPGALNEEIEFPDSEISIEVAGLAERSASISGGSLAFYPNVAADTDLAISPTPSGVETMTQLRSLDSPDVGTYRFSLPSGAELVATDAGGAEVRSGEDILLSVPAPSAIDAAGEAMSAELEVSGDTMTVTVDVDEDATLPILVDPLFQTYEWATKNTSAGICSNSIKAEQFNQCNNREEWGYDVVTTGSNGQTPLHMQVDNYDQYTPGITIKAHGSQNAGDHGTVLYTVPRYFKENPRPRSFIKSLKLTNVTWEANSPGASPYLFMGIWDSTIPGWVRAYQESSQTGHGNKNTAFIYNFEDKFTGGTEYDREAKAAQITVNATQTTGESLAKVYVGAATVELGDEEVPRAPEPTPQTQWVNQSAPPIAFTAVDYGLGVYAVSASTEAVDAQGNPVKTWKAAGGCIGVGDSACPQTWVSSKYNTYIPNAQPLNYEPNALPTGINNLKVVSEDPVGNKSSTSWEEVRVDHIAPVLALTGSITEQEQLGTRRATYTLKANGADGNAENPQSGIAKAEVKLDGKAVAMEGKQAEEWAPKCATKNCPLSAEWTLNTAGLSEGNHTVEVIATDAVGISTTKTLSIETHTATPPTLTLSGSMTEQATLGTSRPRYTVAAKSTAVAAGFEAPTLGASPAYISTFGGYGSGNSQFFIPSDAAVDANGNLWVVDKFSRVQKFNAKGEWLLTAGAGGSGAGQLSAPSAIALDATGNVWVSDTANNRIVEFNEQGQFVETFGTNVNKTKVEAAGTEAEKNLCTAASGNVCQAGSATGMMKAPAGIALSPNGWIWVVDAGNSRIERFVAAGTLLSTFSGPGSEPGQLKEPKAITIAPDGSIWVADYGNNRIEQWNSSLTFVRAIGKEGSGAGEFKNPAAIEADSTGNIWVGDQKNNRVEEFDRTGVYLGQFGSGGSGSGQFSLGAWMGLTVDVSGSIWITDPGHNKVQHWMIPGFPVYSSSIGSFGTGPGKFISLADVATDSQGNLWGLDKENGYVQKFNEKGEWQLTAGSTGSSGGKLNYPSSIALDGSNNVWVADTSNNRVVEFNEKGEFLKTFGTNVNKTKVEAAGTEAEKNLCTAASGNVCQAATAGSLAGQLKAPKGIAVTSGGNIWVADTGNSRIEKFGPTGNMLNNLSGQGSEPGKLKEPTGIAVAPDGSIWVADTGNNRIEQWNSSLSLVRVIGKEGTGGGEFKAPASIEADSSGNVWVGDQKNNRIEEFAEGGRYLGQLGAEGSGKFSFGPSMGIAVDPGGSIWVTDGGHFKIQKWTQESPKSEITTTLWLDNKQQNGLHGTCKGSSCMIEPQWTVGSKALSAGAHSAKVKTTDGLGRSTESTVSFQITPDTVKPTLEAGGELVNAPEGWVEQETYGFHATAIDGGSGVTSIVFKIDGQQVASASQACPDGACNETLSEQVSMASYSGGSHPAEIVAADGAGNTLKEQWVINVDPEGHISSKEAEATLEAVEGTSEGTPIAPNEELLEPEQMEFGDNPELEQTGSKISSTGVPTLTTMTTNPAAGFTITSPYGETTISPVATETSTTAVVEGVAGVSANSKSQSDTVIRPEYNGVQIFQAIRSESSPENYSWNVHLFEGQTLQIVDSTHAQVMYESGKRAFLITAEEAHDATGKEVPTSLEVSGNVLSLKVEFHKDAFVYPVLAGAGWETAYRTPYLIQGPENELEIEAREKAEHEAPEPTPPPPASGYFTESEAQKVITAVGGGPDIIPAPDPPAPGGASASTVPEKVVTPYRRCSSLSCGVWWIEMRNPSYHYKRNENNRMVAYWQYGTILHSETWYPGYYWPELNVVTCDNGFVGDQKVWEGEHKHLTIWARFKITASVWWYEGDVYDFVNREAMQIWVWPNGFQQRVHNHWEPTQQWIEEGRPCSY
ncbi:MAG TPA: NHL repeat-containing protein [Solirubrobacterales bacterium]|nr:NHL repeat-containing protein [Solirubrobacterales bacterium]